MMLEGASNSSSAQPTVDWYDAWRMNMQDEAGARQQTGVRHQPLARLVRNASFGTQPRGRQPPRLHLRAAAGAHPAD